MHRLLLTLNKAPLPRPDQISGLTFWLDADYDPSFSVDAVTGAVASWTTRDSNARVFTPVSGTATTRIIRSRKPGFQGRNVVTTQLTANTGLSCPAYDIASNFAANGKDITVFAVIRSDEAVQTFGTLYYHYTTGAIGHYFRTNHSTGTARWLCLNSTTFISGSNAAYLNRERIICFKRSGDTVTLYIDGQQISTATATATAIVTTSSVEYIGCSSASGGGFHGDIRALLILQRQVDPS